VAGGRRCGGMRDSSMLMRGCIPGARMWVVAFGRMLDDQRHCLIVGPCANTRLTGLVHLRLDRGLISRRCPHHVAHLSRHHWSPVRPHRRRPYRAHRTHWSHRCHRSERASHQRDSGRYHHRRRQCRSADHCVGLEPMLPANLSVPYRLPRIAIATITQKEEDEQCPKEGTDYCPISIS
jgi:hypothetical protein